MHQDLTQRQPQTSTIGLVEIAMFLQANKALKQLAARFSCDAKALFSPAQTNRSIQLKQLQLDLSSPIAVTKAVVEQLLQNLC